MDVPASRTAILPVADFLARQLKKASIVMIVSDFMSDEDLGNARQLKMLARRHDVIGVLVEDPVESALPAGSGALSVRDLETGSMVRIGLGRRLRRRYDALVGRRRSDLVHGFYRVPMDHVVIRPDQNVIEPLLRLFASRRRA
jgi:hypothetical protein